MKKVALVTGGTDGIGYSISSKLLEKDVFVIATYASNEEKAWESKQEFAKISSNFQIIKSSNNVEKDVVSLANIIKKQFGKLDFLINNAGISKSNISLKMSMEEWDRVLDVNLTGTFLTSKNMAPLLFKSKTPSIVNISSQVGTYGNIGQANYAAAKAGIFGLTHTLAQEFSKKKVRVNSVAPGFVETKILTEIPENLVEKRKERILLNRFAEPEEIANVVYFLVSEDSSYINSTTINVDGGIAF